MVSPSTPEMDAVREQARQLLARLTVLKPDAFPHQHTPWTDGEVAHLRELAAGTPLAGAAATAAHGLRELARIVEHLTPYPPLASPPTPASSPYAFSEYQEHYADAFRWLDMIVRRLATPPDPRWGPHAS
jgi:hypothetical protein